MTVKKKKPTLKFKRLNSSALAPIRAHDSDCGYDLFSAVKIRIPGNTKRKINTGISFEIPEGYRLEIKERSSVASTTSLRIAGGIIDQGYRGEIIVILENTGDRPHEIFVGDKVAQAILYENILLDVEEEPSISEDTERGTKGFGSSENKET